MAGDQYSALGLDLGSTLGFAFYRGGRIISGERPLSAGGDVLPGEVFCNFQAWLEKYRGVDLLVFEDVRGIQSYNFQKLYYGLRGIVEMFHRTHRIPLVGVNPQTLKRRFAGHGHASKHDMCATAHAMGWAGGFHGTDDNNNEADAIAVLVNELRERGIITDDTILTFGGGNGRAV